MQKSPKSPSHDGLVSQALHALVSKVPPSAEPAAVDPKMRSQSIAKSAALRAAALSGTMSLPPGPFGLLTVLPDLLSVWRLQQQLVADIAAAHGKGELLTPEVMVVCLFRHGSRAETADLVAHTGGRMLIRRVAESTLRQLLGKIGVRLTRRLAARGFSRWLPLIGALGMGAYAYYDTSQVAANAIELFSKDVSLDATPPKNGASHAAKSERRVTPAKSSRSHGSPQPPTTRPAKTPRSAKRHRSSPPEA